MEGAVRYDAELHWLHPYINGTRWHCPVVVLGRKPGKSDRLQLDADKSICEVSEGFVESHNGATERSTCSCNLKIISAFEGTARIFCTPGALRKHKVGGVHHLHSPTDENQVFSRHVAWTAIPGVWKRPNRITPLLHRALLTVRMKPFACNTVPQRLAPTADAISPSEGCGEPVKRM